jgi:4-hydroxy-2-oxovalerate aldolase
METPKKPMILDTTLRDGSYVINFQFTAYDTELLCSELDEAGVPMIEVGHGVGLGASESGKGQAIESDEAYLEAAARGVKRAMWGMFCIPGIARLEHVDLAASYGMKFIRIGTNITEVEQSKSFIERARKHGMFVCANFMKSYTMPPSYFAEVSKTSSSYGAQMIYIVDSAGGMLPAELRSYIQAVKESADIKLGFHGHNNLGMAVANSLQAIASGVDYIDTSLQGMGRSGGNTPTEMLTLILERQGMHTGIDFLKLMDIGEERIRPLLRTAGLSSLDLIAGFAQFHSSYMGVIREFSHKYRVDPRRLIMAVCERDKVNAPRKLVEECAENLATTADEVVATGRFGFDRYFGNEQAAEE